MRKLRLFSWLGPLALILTACTVAASTSMCLLSNLQLGVYLGDACGVTVSLVQVRKPRPPEPRLNYMPWRPAKC